MLNQCLRVSLDFDDDLLQPLSTVPDLTPAAIGIIADDDLLTGEPLCNSTVRTSCGARLHRGVGTVNVVRIAWLFARP